jgi:hypothetical protein
MASPFPGMDPFLESPAYWPDFHATFINYWREVIADILPDAYEARINEQVFLIEPERPRRKKISPDVAVTNGGQGTGSRPANAPAGVLVLEPVTIPFVELEEVRQGAIEILHRPERSLVAVLELLSPSNKEEPGRSPYLDKRNAVLQQLVHLVEVDLLRAGQRVPLSNPLPPGDYFAFIGRAEKRPDCQVYSWTLRQPLPALPIPLRAPDPDVWVDLQAVLTTTYERGRFGRSLPYDLPPPGQFADADRAWVQERVLARGG